MADYALVTLGDFIFDGRDAALVGDLVIGAIPRNVQVAANAISAEPVQVLWYDSDFGLIKFHAKLSGRETISEAAPNHLRRMWQNLVTEVGNDTNTLTVAVWGMDDPLTYRIFKNDRFDKTITALTQARSVMEFDVALKYLT